MKAFLSIAASAIPLLSLVAPALASSQFYLTLHSSSNATYDGTILEACDVGGARTGLCARGATVATGPTANNVFQFKQVSTGSGLAATGFIQWIRVGTSANTTYNAGFAGNSQSNVVSEELKTDAAPYGGYVAWNDNNILSIPATYDDTTGKETGIFTPTGYYRWQICDRTLLTGNVPGLSWQLGKYAPENPTCQAITVQRQFL